MNQERVSIQERKVQELQLKKLYRESHYSECRQLALGFISEKPTSWAYLFGARASKRLGLAEEALTIFLEGYERYDDDIYLISDLAKHNKDLRKNEDAIRFCKKGLEIDPQQTSLQLLYANLLELSGERENAQKILETILQGDAQSPETLYRVAHFYYNQGSYDKSLTVLEENNLLESKTQSALLYGKNKQALEQYKEAQEVYISILSKNSEDRQAEDRLVQVVGIMLKKERAQRKKEELSSLIDQHKIIYRTAGMMAFECECVDYAKELYQKALKHDENLAEAYERFVTFHLELGNLSEAETLIQECREKEILSEKLSLHETSIARSRELLSQYLPKKLSSEQLRLPEHAYEALLNIPNDQLAVSPQSDVLAVVIHSLGPGGAELQCANLLRGLASRKDHPFKKIYLLCKTLSRSEKDAFHLKKLSHLDIEIIEYGKIKNEDTVEKLLSSEQKEILDLLIPVSRKSHLLQLIGLLREIRPQIVHSYLDETSIVAALATNIIGNDKIVVRWGNLPPPQLPNLSDMERERKRCFRYIYKVLSSQTNCSLYSNAKRVSEEYAKWIGIKGKKVKTVVNGYDFSTLLPSNEKSIEIRNQLQIPPEAKVIGGTFHITDKKRPFLWLEVVRDLVQQPENFAILVGDGHLKEELGSKIHEYGLEKKIHLVGRQENIADWYNTMDALLLTSMSEGLPNVVIEAQALGVPVVVPDVGGCSETCLDGTTGLIIRSDDPKEFQKTLRKILEDDAWRENASKAATKYAKQHFSEDLLVQRTLDLYAGVISKEKKSGQLFYRIAEKASAFFN